MIASIRGGVQQTGDSWIIIDLGGLGVRVSVPAPLAARARAGQDLALFTHLLVREDALALFGFDTPDQLSFFELLLGISGIGPKVALSLLSHFSTDTLRQAVARGAPERLSGIPGVGKKTAEKIIFHLKDRLAGEAGAAAPGWSETDTEVVAALTSLGYSIVEAQAALQRIPADAPADAETRLRLALQSLDRK
ncbi:MAG: Holliday junction branch migration protein RuvA [Anaerolineales bacterium]|nr:Holliday junction branch migration protein RuvA [Anaerolineales bacterium]